MTIGFSFASSAVSSKVHVVFHFKEWLQTSFKFRQCMVADCGSSSAVSCIYKRIMRRFTTDCCICQARAQYKIGLLTVFKPKPKPRFLARTEENRNPNFSWA